VARSAFNCWQSHFGSIIEMRHQKLASESVPPAVVGEIGAGALVAIGSGVFKLAFTTTVLAAGLERNAAGGLRCAMTCGDGPVSDGFGSEAFAADRGAGGGNIAAPAGCVTAGATATRCGAGINRSRYGLHKRYTATSSTMMMDNQNRRFPATAILPLGRVQMTYGKHRHYKSETGTEDRFDTAV
jgi:hypothetical protein